MSTNHSITSNYMPLKEFLEFFGITLGQYYDLQKVPFPVVRSSGRVIYRYNGSYYYYDMNTNNPDDTDRSGLTQGDVLDTCLVDFSVFNNTGSRDFVFRFGFSPIDEGRTNFHDRYIKTQTKDSSRDIFLDIKTGINREDWSLLSQSYPYTTLDILNSVDPMLSNIRSGNYTGSVVNGVLTLTPIRKTLFGNNPMANASTTAVTSVLDQNKLALITATKLEVGTLALDLLTEQLLKALPAPLQLLVTNNPLVKIAVANLVNVIILQTNLNDPKIQAVNEAMLTVSWMETIKTFDFKAIIDGVISNIPAGKVDTLVSSQPIQEG